MLFMPSKSWPRRIQEPLGIINVHKKQKSVYIDHGITMMKAIVYNKKQSPYKQILQDVEKPIPNDDEVLLKVFFGIN